MRRNVIVGVLVALVAALAVGWLVNGDGDEGTAASAVAGLESKQVDAGPVAVEITPVQFDAEGAAFTVVFDNHVQDLEMDLPAEAELTVGGVVWPERDWSGDAPGGHHREGELTFDQGGPARGAVRLTIGGLPEPVAVMWAPAS